MKKLLLSMLLVGAMAIPAFASVQNVKVSGSIDSTWLNRKNFDLGDFAYDPIINNGQSEDTHQNLFITQTTLQIDADLTDNVSATIGLINERVWQGDPSTTASGTGIDLNLAYITLREMLYSPLTVVIGRQAFSYGNSFIMDSSGTNNSAPTDSGLNNVAEDLTKQTALDAVRLIFDYNPLTVEVMYSKISSGVVLADEDHTVDDIDLFGVNATYELGDAMNTQIETYFFARTDKRTNDGDALNGTKSSKIYIPGLRASTNPIEGLNIQGEIALQRGNTASTTNDADNQRRKALGAQFLSTYQVPVAQDYNPVLQYKFTYVSGDSNPTDARSNSATTPASSDVNTAWDPFYENQDGGTIYNSLFSLSNLIIHSVSLQANPMEDVTTKVSLTGLWLDKEVDKAYSGTGSESWTLVQPGGSSAAPDVNKDGTALGYEIDLDAIYDYTEDVQFGATVGWFVPGSLFEQRNDSVASQVLVHSNVNF
ncbi:hypothetical protein MNBD_UNCLBAC01-1007 [hydrothermal vent metagenome]|uniref:Alginate export domain-containing protein n=1 Tax=hydrothermal vent metagenome TaxID=652676 RepID=A0A3B1D0D1_9ZZZZ